MNKANELLERTITALNNYDFSPTTLIPLRDDIEAYLSAQPDTDEPVCKRCLAYKSLVASLETQLSWHRNQSTKYNEAIKTLDSERECNDKLTKELSAQPREPLSYEEIKTGFYDLDSGYCAAEYESFKAGISWAERQHGIGS